MAIDIDLIYEGITTRLLGRLFALAMVRIDIDLIYEGITTSFRQDC